ncbi:hypothetical protein [Paenibacillus sp. TSA_86.1]|uniref:hypothetical protein n=1 Tax=Paenibacillus sp. TSA_86.1 TaxID=3415649 RepID=UPI0040459919
MIDNEVLERDRLFIKSWLDTYFDSPYRDILMSHPAKMEEEDYGVPADMQDGEVEEEGWVRWIMLDSEVTVEQINELAASYIKPGSDTYSSSFSLPPLYMAYLSSRYVLNVYLRYEGFIIELPNLPSDYPLRELRNLWSSSESLIKAGYIPFASYEDHAGPVCWDTSKPNDDKDYAVVWFDHDILTEEGQTSRNQLEAYAQPLFHSFREMLMRSPSSTRS